MEITTIKFAVLAIISIILFYLINNKYRNVFLAIISCIFIATYNYYLLVYTVAYAYVNYLIGRKIPDCKFKKALFRIGIIFNLVQIIILKYASFAIDPLLEIFNISGHVSKLSEMLVPVGISFFTLQAIGYLVNIKMGWEKPERKFLKFLLYINFYPKFLSGPIERSQHFLPQIKASSSFDVNQVSYGLRIALFGFFKKIVIANQLGLIVTSAYSNVSSLGGLNLWIVVFIQPLYLYFDFSGYTDIAIGIAKTYGIELLPNFNKPFLSENVSTLWRRMHMSLSLWFNDYVFKQVSFRYRRWGKYASVFAVFVTFTLFGIWHGAGWNFMILGFLQALAINYEFFTKRSRTKIFSKLPDFYRIWMGRLFTYLFFSLSHIFFFAPNIKVAFSYFNELKNFNWELKTDMFSKTSLLAIGLFIFFLTLEILGNDKKALFKKIENYWNNHSLLRIAVYYLMVMLILTFIGNKLTFIYKVF